MQECELPREGLLPNPVHLKMSEPGISFDQAERAAKNLAKSYFSEPKLLSWFDRKRKLYSPEDIQGCTEGGPPSWVEYAASRGGNLAIDVNNEEYVFVFRGKQEMS